WEKTRLFHYSKGGQSLFSTGCWAPLNSFPGTHLEKGPSAMTKLLSSLVAGLLLAASLGLPAFVTAQDAPQVSKERMQKLLNQLKTGEDQAKVDAMQELAELGPLAAPAIPDLIENLSAKNEDLRLN